MADRSEIIVGAKYEVDGGVHDWCGTCSVSRIVDEFYFYVKKIIGLPHLTHYDKENNDYRVAFSSPFAGYMKLIDFPEDKEIDIKFSFDELLGE